WATGRWFVLIVGALVGLVMYTKSRNHSYGAFHLTAFFCVVSALISAVVPAYPEQAILKALSLLLLFLYAASGIRFAVAGREGRFFSGMQLGCEVLTYGTAISYF